MNEEDDGSPDWVKFLINKLDFRLEKVRYMQENHGVDSCEAFFDAYAPESEDGLRNHEFNPKPKEIQEEKENDEESPALCMVCEQTESKHPKYKPCPVCYERTKQ